MKTAEELIAALKAVPDHYQCTIHVHHGRMPLKGSLCSVSELMDALAGYKPERRVCPACGHQMNHYVDTEHSSIPSEGWKCPNCGHET